MVNHRTIGVYQKEYILEVKGLEEWWRILMQGNLTMACPILNHIMQFSIRSVQWPDE